MDRPLAILRCAITALGLTLSVGVVTAASTTPGAAAPACKCRYFGEFYELGTSVCIRGRVATCALVLNNSSWRISKRRCQPVASRGGRQSLADAPRQSRPITEPVRDQLSRQ